MSDLLPSLICGSLIFLTFDLGQPNLLLLAFILAGFVAIEAGRRGLGGALIGFAAAIKAFPIAILFYLAARRQWRAASAMVLALAIFSLAVPAAVFGPGKAVSDLTRWTRAMTSVDEQVFGQRPNHNWSYRNQSLFALTHRLTRPIDAAESPTPAGAFTINVVDLGFAGANRVYLALCALIGGAFLLLLAKADARRREVRVCELAILLSLDVVASPEAHDYYFVWLIFPIAALIDFYRTARPGARATRARGLARRRHAVHGFGDQRHADHFSGLRLPGLGGRLPDLRPRLRDRLAPGWSGRFREPIATRRRRRAVAAKPLKRRRFHRTGGASPASRGPSGAPTAVAELLAYNLY